MFGNNDHNHNHFNALLPPRWPSLLFVTLCSFTLNCSNILHWPCCKLVNHDARYLTMEVCLIHSVAVDQLIMCHDSPVQYGVHNGKFSFGVMSKSGHGWCNHPIMTSEIPASIVVLNCGFCNSTWQMLPVTMMTRYWLIYGMYIWISRGLQVVPDNPG